MVELDAELITKPRKEHIDSWANSPNKLIDTLKVVSFRNAQWVHNL